MNLKPAILRLKDAFQDNPSIIALGVCVLAAAAFLSLILFPRWLAN